MSIAIVGYTGFVGSNLLQFYNFTDFYNSKNFKECIGKTFDQLFFCGVPAVKWYANKNPDEDWFVINEIIEILKTIKVNKFILISTIDVYEDCSLQYNEDYLCNYEINHTYGKNRYIFEKFIQDKFDNHHIIRLPALFGKGLKKNIIYDLINKNYSVVLTLNSSFQWYNLDWLKTDIDNVILQNIKVCNFFTEPIKTLEILNLFDYSQFQIDNKTEINYNLKTKYFNYQNTCKDTSGYTCKDTSGYIRSKNDVYNEIKKFIIFFKINKDNLVVSNICVKDISQLQFSCLLKLYGIKNIQIAPTTIINSWNDLQNIDLSIYKNNVYSFQSITYTLNELNVFNDKNDQLFNHIKNVIDIASKHNVHVLVFGCPKNRYINHENDNELTFIDFFKRIGDYCMSKKVIICIEPNSKKYGCNFLNTIHEVGNIVNKIDNQNIKMMIDIGNAIMENDNLNDIYQYTDILYNVDISTEFMKSFTNPHKSVYNLKHILNDIGYKHKINLEMLPLDLQDLRISLNFFINIFGS
uniref:Xylose isomerase-like TIM barrel domain-containing protein n=1 Tax=viral metagenome TaxID=1070528 RepID=A0A6C0I8E6_9ZZZZ